MVIDLKLTVTDQHFMYVCGSQKLGPSVNKADRSKQTDKQTQTDRHDVHTDRGRRTERDECSRRDNGRSIVQIDTCTQANTQWRSRDVHS